MIMVKYLWLIKNVYYLIRIFKYIYMYIFYGVDLFCFSVNFNVILLLNVFMYEE